MKKLCRLLNNTLEFFKYDIGFLEMVLSQPTDTENMRYISFMVFELEKRVKRDKDSKSLFTLKTLNTYLAPYKRLIVGYNANLNIDSFLENAG